MNESTVNFTTSETSTNSTTHYSGVIHSLNICVFSISFTFGFPAHCYILWLIVTGAEQRVASEFFNINLSVCEIGSSLTFFFYILKNSWFSHLTNVTGFLNGLAITGRPLFQCLMCVERYLAVVHPVTFLKYKPLRYRVICCVATWVVTLSSCLYCMYTSNEKVRYSFQWFLSTQFLLFLSIQLFCLVAVLRALKQSGPGERKRKDENHMKRKVFHLILITTASMVIVYGPYIIIGFVTMKVKQLRDPLWLVGLTCYVLAGFVHPVLYLHSAGKLPPLCLP